MGETILLVGENSSEFKLYSMLSNSDFKVDEADKSKDWISLDRTYFGIGSTDLTKESTKQLSNIASILKNFPAASIKIGGYTDNIGLEDINKKLSTERATIVAKSMVNLAVSQMNINTEGYGSQHPICSKNEEADCLAQNRRVDIRISTK